jgi:hypothetical protein
MYEILFLTEQLAAFQWSETLSLYSTNLRSVEAET